MLPATAAAALRRQCVPQTLERVAVDRQRHTRAASRSWFPNGHKTQGFPGNCVPVRLALRFTMNASFPTLPVDGAALLLQPMVGTYLPVARALATSLLYRFFRLLTPCGVRTAQAVTAASVCTLDTSPELALQITLAEWLLVYVGLHAQKSGGIGGFLELDARKLATLGFEVHNRVQPLLAKGMFPAAEDALVPPAVLLVLCASSYARQDRGALCPRVATRGKRVQAALAAGLAAPVETYMAALRALVAVDAARDPYGCSFVLFEPSTADLPLSSVAISAVEAALGNSWPGGGKPTTPPMPYPRAIQVDAPPSKVAATIDHTLVGLVISDSPAFVWAVLPVVADAPLEPLFMHFIVDSQLAGPARAEFTPLSSDSVSKLTSRVRLQFPLTPKRVVTDAVVACCQRAFGEDAFKRAMGASQSASQPASQPATKPATKPASQTAVSTKPAVPTPPKLDSAASTLSAALRAPKLVRPGRWFTRGPAMLTLFYTHDAFAKIAAPRRVLTAFFEELGARRVNGKDVVVFNRTRSVTATGGVQPLARLVPSTSERGAYELQTCTASSPVLACPPESTEELTGSLLSSVVFTAADCVWAAHHASSRPRDIIFTLWNEFHVHNGPSRSFTDEANALVFQYVVAADLRDAHHWMRDALCDMVFAHADADAVDALLREWNALVALTTVVTDADKLYTASTPDIGSAIMGTGVFIRGTDDDELPTQELVHQTLSRPKPLSPNALRARPLVRGFMLTTTQLALLFSIGTRAEFKALNACLDATDPEALNLPILTSVMDNDRVEMRKRLSKLDADLPEHMSLLSRASTATLRV